MIQALIVFGFVAFVVLMALLAELFNDTEKNLEVTDDQRQNHR